MLAALDRLLKITPRWVRLLGLDAVVTSHVEGITADVIRAEIIGLEAELAGHDPDEGTDAYPARQPGTRRWPHRKSRSEMEAATTKAAPREEPATPVKDQS